MPAFTLTHSAAIITGASSGLGAEFARQLAPHAQSLLLVARREEALKSLALELRKQHPECDIGWCVCDVTQAEDRRRLFLRVAEWPTAPNLLINNAGMGDYGPFASADESKIEAQIGLNITALTLLTHGLLPYFECSAERPAGILNVSSLAGTVPMPDLAVYAASKAFVTSFSEALRVELAPRHIIVSALCPGPTPTNFSQTARRADGTDTDRGGQGLLRMPPEEVVRQGLAALVHDRATVYPGLGVRIASTLFRLLPRPLMRYVLRRRHQRSLSSP